MKLKTRKMIIKVVLMAFFTALCYVLPFLTGQIPQIGKMLLPMHLPVMLCGFLVGPFGGAVVGAAAPVSRSLLFGMPAMTTAIPMAAEMSVYGLVTGLLFRLLENKKVNLLLNTIISLATSMILGRIAGGLVTFTMITAKNQAYGFGEFISSYFVVSALGILLQFLIVPAVVVPLSKTKTVKALR